MKKLVRVSAAIALIAVLLGIVMWFAFPWILAREVENEARAKGVDLSVQRAELGPRRVIFHGVRVKRRDGVEIEGTVTAVLDLPFLLKRNVVITDGSARARGASSESVVELFAIAGTVGRHEGGRLGSALDLATSVAITSSGKRIAGPWKLHATQRGDAGEQRLELDASAKDAALVERHITAERTTTRVEIRGVPLANLALPPLPFARPHAKLELHADSVSTGAAPDEDHRGKAKLSLSEFFVPGAPTSAPVATEFSFTAKGNKGRIEKGRLVFDVFRAAIDGDVELGIFPRLALRIAGDKMPCAKLLESTAEDAFPGVNEMMVRLDPTGRLRELVKGDIGFDGSLAIDLAQPNAARLEVRPTGACKVAIPLFPLQVTAPK